MDIRSLGYVGFGAPDPQQWLTYATEVLGLMPARACAGEDWGVPRIGPGPASGGSGVAPDGSVYLKMDEQQWRIAIHPSEQTRGLMYLGLEVESGRALAEAIQELQDAGVDARMGSQEQALNRSVSGIGYTEDPSGNPIELYYGPIFDRNFQSPLGIEFVAGALGLGHINLLVRDFQESNDFYTQLLGFRLTDYIDFGGSNSANFYHCNSRHHSIGLIKIGEAIGVHHMMLEVANVDMVGACLERVLDAGINITSTLGRHVNDRMLSFYMSSPFGFEVEIGCDPILLDDQWTANKFVEGDIWGHKGTDPKTIAKNLEKLNTGSGILDATQGS